MSKPRFDNDNVEYQLRVLQIHAESLLGILSAVDCLTDQLCSSLSDLVNQGLVPESARVCIDELGQLGDHALGLQGKTRRNLLKHFQIDA